MHDITIELINKIKSLRKEKGITQIELAKRCNVPQSTIGRIENFSMNTSIDIVCKILDVLNLKIDLVQKNKIRKGYDVFGKEYGVMLRNDLHDIFSIEHKLMQEQIRLDSVSEPFLYGSYEVSYPMGNHELYNFSLQFKKDSSLTTIKELVKCTSNIAQCYDVPLSEMIFGGTEKEILNRGTDWCFDMARLACVILDCLGLTSRFVFVANPNKAYNGHVVLEVFYEEHWGVVDPLMGYVFYDSKPISAKEILQSKQLNALSTDYHDMFLQVAIAEYDPNDVENIYNISKCNEYTLKLNSMKQNGKWLLGEDK